MKQTKDNFPYFFLIVSLLAILNCANRNDYNLPLGIFAYLLWNYPYQRSQKHRILWLLILSIFCDLLWFLIVSVGEWGEVGGNNRLKSLTQILTIVNMCLKTGVVVFAFLKKQGCDNLFTMEAFRSEVIVLKDQSKEGAE